MSNNSVEPKKPALTEAQTLVVQRNYEQAVLFLREIEKRNMEVIFDGEADGGHTIITRITAPSDKQLEEFQQFYTRQADDLESTPEVQAAYAKRALNLRRESEYVAYSCYPDGAAYKFLILTDVRDSPVPLFREEQLWFSWRFSDDPDAVRVSSDGKVEGRYVTPCFWNQKRTANGKSITWDRYRYLFEIPEYSADAD